MPQVTLISAGGKTTVLEVAYGQSLMQAAVSSGYKGIVGECGGSAMCATCHVYVDAEFKHRLPAPLETELEMLECTADERKPESRLSCQIKMAPELEGMTVHVPERQQ